MNQEFWDSLSMSLDSAEKAPQLYPAAQQGGVRPAVADDHDGLVEKAESSAQHCACD